LTAGAGEVCNKTSIVRLIRVIFCGPYVLVNWSETVIKRLDHLNIVVGNLQQASQFFTLLGFRSSEPAELSGEWISSIVGLEDVRARYVILSHPGSDTTIELLEYENPCSERDPSLSKANQIGYRHIAFAVDDIGAAVTQLTESGVRFVSDVNVYQKTGKKLVYFYGPEGILLELAQYPKTENSESDKEDRNIAA
jgi:catechol 2,3-dioxygenase-like lactoylglutathione lyase family enzyme